MPVNKEELLKDLETPEYITLVKETLGKKKFVIQDEAEAAAFLDRYKKDVIEKEIPLKIKEVYDFMDREVKETSGIERETNEKTSDFIKRVLKTKGAEAAASMTKIKELEAAIAAGSTDPALKKKLEDEQQTFKTILKNKDKEIEDVRGEAVKYRKAADIKLIYGELKKNFIKTLPPMFATAEAATLDEVARNSVEKEGRLYMANADGSVKKDASYNEITVEDYLKAAFKEVIETKKTQGGGGSGGGNGGDPGTDPSKLTDENFPMRADIKTKAALMDYMVSLGLKQGTEQFTKIYAKYGRAMTLAV
jgi:hypothetical protein